MKKTNKLFKSFISIAMALVFIFSVGCSESEKKSSSSSSGSSDVTIVERPPEVKEITLSTTSLDMKVGDTQILAVEKFNHDADSDVVWYSEDESIATVDSKGNVEAIGEGETNIVATQGTATAKCLVKSDFKGESAMVTLAVNNEFNIQQGKEFNLYPQISFNGKTFNDAKFTYSVSDTDNFDIDKNGVLVGLKSKTSTEVTIEARWRGQTPDEMSTLRKTIKVNVVDSVNLLVEGYVNDYAEVYTVAEYEGFEFANTAQFNPVVYINGELKQDANISVVSNNTNIEYDATEKKITGKSFGDSVLTITYVNDGKELVETFDVSVLRPVINVDTKVNYFSSYVGTLRDEKDGFKEKTILDYIRPESNLVLTDANVEGTELDVVDNKVFGITGDNTGTYEKTVSLGTSIAVYNVNMTVYGQYVYEAKDLDVFIRTAQSVSYDGYVELGRNVDATGYNNAGTHSASGYYPSYNGTKYSGSAYFSGIFDGKGYAITNLKVNYSDTGAEKGKYGMFCALEGATIKNIAFSNVNIQARSIFGYYTNNSTFENIYIEVGDYAMLGNYQSNIISYMPVSGSNFKNILIKIPSNFAIKEANALSAGSFASVTIVANNAKPVFENCIVVSKLPIGYSLRWASDASISFASNDTDDFVTNITNIAWNRFKESGSALRDSILKNYNKNFTTAPDYDATIDDGSIFKRIGRANKYDGVYRYDTEEVMYTDKNINNIINQFPTEYWLIGDDGKLSWGKEIELPITEGQIYLSVGEVNGLVVEGLTWNLKTFDNGTRVVLPTLSVWGYEFKGWINATTDELVPLINGEYVIESFDGKNPNYIAVWECTSISGPLIPFN